MISQKYRRLCWTPFFGPTSTSPCIARLYESRGSPPRLNCFVTTRGRDRDPTEKSRAKESLPQVYSRGAVWSTDMPTNCLENSAAEGKFRLGNCRKFPEEFQKTSEYFGAKEKKNPRPGKFLFFPENFPEMFRKLSRTVDPRQVGVRFISGSISRVCVSCS